MPDHADLGAASGTEWARPGPTSFWKTVSTFDHVPSKVCVCVCVCFIASFTPIYLAIIFGVSGKEPSYQRRRQKRHGFDPWVVKMPWRRKWQPTPVFLSGKFHGAWQATVLGVTKSRTRPKQLHTSGASTIFHTILDDWKSVMEKKKLSEACGPQELLSSEELLLSHFSRVRLCVTPWTAAYQAPPSPGFSRQEHWSGLPFPSPMHESEK